MFPLRSPEKSGLRAAPLGAQARPNLRMTFQSFSTTAFFFELIIRGNYDTIYDFIGKYLWKGRGCGCAGSI